MLHSHRSMSLKLRVIKSKRREQSETDGKGLTKDLLLIKAPTAGSWEAVAEK